jgi:AcrR family transcriptional regulator
MSGEISSTATDAPPCAPAEPPTKGERTRQRLLELAIERFGERGYRATSVSEIARAAGLTQAAAYAYFESKRALFVAALDADTTALLVQAGAKVDARDGLRITDKPLTYFLELRAAVDDHALVRRVLAGQESEINAFPEVMDLPAVSAIGEEMVAELAEGQARGEVRTDIDAHAIGAGIEGLLMTMLVTSVQLGEMGTERRRDGIIAAFRAMLEPTS